MSGAFLFLPCQDLYKKKEKVDNDRDEAELSVKHGQLHIKIGELFTDLDLVFIKNGALGIGEVKSDPKGFTDEVVDKLRIVALDLLPDQVVVAAHGKQWPPEVGSRLSVLAADLQRADIAFQPLMLQWWDD